MSKIKKLDDFRGQVGKVVSRIRAAQEQIDVTVRKRLRQQAADERKAIIRSFRHGGKKMKRGDELYIFTPEGEKVCTVAQYLKGTYRAFGQGTFQKKMWYDSIKAGNDVGRRSRKNQRQGEYFTKGSGRFSANEKENIRNVARKEITRRQLDREIRKMRDEHARLKEEKQKEEAAAKKKEISKLERKKKQNEKFTRKNDRRIIQRNKYDVAARDVQTHNLFRAASEPGEAPRSWDTSGHYLRRKVEFREEGDGYIVFLPVAESGDDILERLEHGGTTERYALGRKRRKQGDLIGYTIESERDRSSNGARFSHKRVSLQKRFARAEAIDVKPRPIMAPAQERVRKKLPDVFDDIQKLLR